LNSQRYQAPLKLGLPLLFVYIPPASNRLAPGQPPTTTDTLVIVLTFLNSSRECPKNAALTRLPFLHFLRHEATLPRLLVSP
jgi:hypothetical protein